MVSCKFDSVRTVKLFQHLRGERFVRWPIGAYVVVDAKYSVEAFGEIGEVVCSKEDYFALITQ